MRLPLTRLSVFSPKSVQSLKRNVNAPKAYLSTLVRPTVEYRSGDHRYHVYKINGEDYLVKQSLLNWCGNPMYCPSDQVVLAALETSKHKSRFPDIQEEFLDLESTEFDSKVPAWFDALSSSYAVRCPNREPHLLFSGCRSLSTGQSIAESGPSSMFFSACRLTAADYTCKSSVLLIFCAQTSSHWSTNNEYGEREYRSPDCLAKDGVRLIGIEKGRKEKANGSVISGSVFE
jgi:hypothetical protein